MAERCAALPLLRAAWLILAMPIALLGFAAPLAVHGFAQPSPRHALRRFAMPSLCSAVHGLALSLRFRIGFIGETPFPTVSPLAYASVFPVVEPFFYHGPFAVV